MPSFVTNGTPVGTYNCGQGVSQTSYTGVTSAECATYIKALKNNGFTETAPQNTIGGNTFYSYARGTKGLHLAFYPNLDGGTFKIVTDVYNSANEPARQSTGGNLATPTLVQFKREGAEYNPNSSAPGMGYILQLSDGRFILIDSGVGNETDRDNLLARLQSMKPAAHNKPIIAGWIFTHAHGDHMGLANQFLQAYAGQIELQAVYANFPALGEDFTVTYEEIIFLSTSYNDFYSHIAAKFPNAKNYKFQTGETFYIGDAKIDILYTHQDYYPQEFLYGNDTSSAFRITVKETEVVFLGDCDVRSSPEIAEMFGSSLKCDILQVSHHGLNGGDIELYKLLDPDICFWPIDQTRFETDERCLGKVVSGHDYAYNGWLRSLTTSAGTAGHRDREHYTASVTTVINLTTGQVTQP